jgi:hypothetical protein
LFSVAGRRLFLAAAVPRKQQRGRRRRSEKASAGSGRMYKVVRILVRRLLAEERTGAVEGVPR